MVITAKGQFFTTAFLVSLDKNSPIDYDRKKFTPHVTLILKVPAPKGEMTVKKLSLMKTTSKDSKPIYSEVCSI